MITFIDFRFSFSSLSYKASTFLQIYKIKKNQTVKRSKRMQIHRHEFYIFKNYMYYMIFMTEWRLWMGMMYGFYYRNINISFLLREASIYERNSWHIIFMTISVCRWAILTVTDSTFTMYFFVLFLMLERDLKQL